MPNQRKSQLLELYKEKKYTEAEALALDVLKDSPSDVLSWKVLDAVLKQTGRIKESLLSSQKAVHLQPKAADTHNNLGIALKEIGDLNGAEASYRQAISINPVFFQAYNNLGIALKEKGRLTEAEDFFRQATKIKPDFYQAFNNLGIVLREQGDFEGSEENYKHAISLNSEFSDAFFNLGVIKYEKNDITNSLNYFESAYSKNPQAISLMVISLLRARHYKNEENISAKRRLAHLGIKKFQNPIIDFRPVEELLLSELYKLRSIKLNESGKIARSDARFGNGICYPDFNLFDEQSTLIMRLKEELLKIIKINLKQNVYLEDSFFNIMSSGAGTTPHMHVNDLDKKLSFVDQKWSLVYYLAVGDQQSSQPGDLTLYDPAEVIRPTEGMVVIMPASRKHSSVYNGKIDRAMIGVNFYSL
ncbi:tetratricopeptide repeat protein [Gammaproteobacteria bacterium]|nr:tetratricopeptide repeat protein [Gammaproteobacteria bacterium]